MKHLINQVFHVAANIYHMKGAFLNEGL